MIQFTQHGVQHLTITVIYSPSSMPTLEQIYRELNLDTSGMIDVVRITYGLTLKNQLKISTPYNVGYGLAQRLLNLHQPLEYLMTTNSASFLDLLLQLESLVLKRQPFTLILEDAKLTLAMLRVLNT